MAVAVNNHYFRIRHSPVDFSYGSKLYCLWGRLRTKSLWR